MAPRVLAISLVLCGGVALALALLVLNERPFEVSGLRPSHDGARPCLVSVERCSQLSDTPFAPCSARAERCSQEWSVERLGTFVQPKH